jgi:hypothetical protein
MNRLVLTAGGLAAALVLLLAGCGGGVNMNGPFGDSPSGSVGSQCSWYPRGSVGTLGMLSFSNSGGPARIDKVTLVDAHHLQVVSEWIVRITGHDLVGVMGGYPPVGTKGDGPGFLAPGIHWATRQRAAGATVVHTPFPDAINLVLVLRATAVKGTARTVYVDYESGGIKYRLDLAVGIELFSSNQRGCLNTQTS